MEGSFGVRKGTWTEEEDILLSKCIDKFGEGEWYQVPQRAGLNRCRKSCRQRWLNYLKPNIKRGNFGADEVDLLLRLHRLLGNRWSMIAGRLPGRTANDVKNYWNTHLKKNVITCIKDMEKKAQDSVDRVKVIKPQPRIFSKNLTWLNQISIVEERFDQPMVDVANDRSPAPMPYKLSELILSDDKESDETATCTKNIGLDEDDQLNSNFWLDEIGPEAINIGGSSTSNFGANEYLTNWLGDLSDLDMGVWDFFPISRMSKDQSG